MKIISTTVLPAKLEHLPAFIEAVMEAATCGGVAQKRLFNIELAMEEVLTNIMHYAYEGAEGDIRVVCRSESQQWFTIEIIDNGKAFDMTAVPTPDLTGTLSERKIGGLGIHFVKMLTDDVLYRREGNRNILEMKISLVSSTVQ
ncbi:MAG: Serine/threonine-protein kinase BtrW [Syntrophorhabdus sp. PtaU1.Bin050]|nr:MAG: Serine/threonine-protein kinase BtrW [Syntrophorhabdus sp. PtaU1.Bin050]